MCKEGMTNACFYIPISFMDGLEVLNSNYPSKSYCVRRALKDFLIKTIQKNDEITGEKHPELIKKIQDENIYQQSKGRGNKPLGNIYHPKVSNLGINEGMFE